MEPKKLLQADYLDILFDNRNKSYGGYELRRSYSSRMRKASGMMFLGVSALLSFSFITRDKGLTVKPHTDPMVLTDVHILPPPVAPQIIPPTPPPPPQHIHTQSFTIPKIIEDVDLDDKPMTENKDLHNVQPGPANAMGDSVDLRPVAGSGKGKGTGIVTGTGNNTNVAVRWVEQMPQFKGDMNAYIGNHLRYPEAARSGGIEGQVIVEFVVNEDGSVSNAKIIRGIGGGCDEEAVRMVSGMPGWKPGKQNGYPVKVLFTLPIRFMLN